MSAPKYSKQPEAKCCPACTYHDGDGYCMMHGQQSGYRARGCSTFQPVYEGGEITSPSIKGKSASFIVIDDPLDLI
jgi:hypothetical protein